MIDLDANEFSDCVSVAEDESQDLLLEPVGKPKQSTIELLLLRQQTQGTTQESIAQQTSNTLTDQFVAAGTDTQFAAAGTDTQFATAGTDTQDSLANAREVGRQQALAFGNFLDNDGSDEADVDTCCANDQCRSMGLRLQPRHRCFACKGMVHLGCIRADAAGLDVCLECHNKAWIN